MKKPQNFKGHLPVEMNGRRRSAIFTGQNNSSEDLPRYKIVVVGDGGVGKSCLTIQYFQRLFVTEYDPTIEDSYIQHTQVDNEWCLLDVLDTAGQDEFSAMGEQYMRTGDGFMLVYSVTDSQSFENIQNFHIQILQVKDGEPCPMLLVANKVDLVHFRKITIEAGKELATKIGAGYIETSAKDPPLNVDAAFHEIIRLVRLYLQKKVEEERKKACFPKCTIL